MSTRQSPERISVRWQKPTCRMPIPLEAGLTAALVIFSLALSCETQAQATRPSRQAPSTSASSGTSLTLEAYLNQVADKHEGFKAAALSAQASNLVSDESTLLLKPVGFGSASSTASGQTNPIGSVNSFQTRAYSLGLSQATSFGLNGKFTLNQTELTIPGFSPSGYNATWGQFEVSQSLLRNWVGREIAAQIEVAQASALTKSFMQTFTGKQILLESEAAYWRLALARELVKVQRDSVIRAKKIADWAERRSSLQLSDRAEFLQASTALQVRRLELRTAEDDERAAAQAFNSSRGLNSNIVAETLVDIRPEIMAQMNEPTRTERRDDVKAAEQQARAGSAAATISAEKNKSTLEIFASLPLNEPAEPTGALSALLPATSRPSTTIGLRFSSPLDFSARSRAREGYAAEAASLAAAYQRKLFEEERDWADLTAKFNQAKARLQLFIALEKVQREKLEYERDRQLRGRSTLQQVLIYENDYEQAQLGRIRTLTEILTLAAQMKLYGVTHESR